MRRHYDLHGGVRLRQLDRLIPHVTKVGKYFTSQLQQLQSEHPSVKDVRGMGLMLAMELDSSELLKRFVAADVGLGFIPRSHAQEDVQANVLAAISLADTQIRRDLALVFRKDKALSRAALAFIEIAVKIKNPEAIATSHH